VSHGRLVFQLLITVLTPESVDSDRCVSVRLGGRLRRWNVNRLRWVLIETRAKQRLVTRTRVIALLLRSIEVSLVLVDLPLECLGTVGAGHTGSAHEGFRQLGSRV
jgi:hypothetical protein